MKTIGNAGSGSEASVSSGGGGSRCEYAEDDYELNIRQLLIGRDIHRYNQQGGEVFVGKITSFECKKPLEGTIYANIPATGQKVGISFPLKLVLVMMVLW